MSLRAAQPNAQRFLFGRGFHAGPDEAEATYSAEQLDGACTEARREGRAEALAEAKESDERRIAIASEAIAAALAEALQQCERVRASSEAAAILIAAAIVRKLLPEFYRREGAGEIEALVNALLPTLLDSPRIVIRLNPVDASRLAERLQQAAADSGFDGRLLILPDEGVEAGDCRIDWTNGGASRNGAKLWQDIEAAIADALPSPGAHCIEERVAGAIAPPAVSGGENV